MEPPFVIDEIKMRKCDSGLLQMTMKVMKLIILSSHVYN